MRTIQLTAEYDGTRYTGWSTPPTRKGGVSVSEKLSTALCRLLAESVSLSCAARTDPGVHAKRQSVSFQTGSDLSLSQLQSSLNEVLPQDIAILNATDMPARFQADLSPHRCIWQLRLQKMGDTDLFAQNYVWSVPCFPKTADMQEAFLQLKGRHDFRCFSPAKKKKAAMKELYAFHVSESHREMVLTLEGNDFLPYMAATVFQLLVDIGLGVVSPLCIPQIFSGESTFSRRVPSRGLYLADIIYTKNEKEDHNACLL